MLAKKIQSLFFLCCILLTVIKNKKKHSYPECSSCEVCLGKHSDSNVELESRLFNIVIVYMLCLFCLRLLVNPIKSVLILFESFHRKIEFFCNFVTFFKAPGKNFNPWAVFVINTRICTKIHSTPRT